eukprot:3881271-Pyramimonas_sp.AAC.1
MRRRGSIRMPRARLKRRSGATLRWACTRTSFGYSTRAFSRSCLSLTLQRESCNSCQLPLALEQRRG